MPSVAGPYSCGFVAVLHAPGCWHTSEVDCFSASSFLYLGGVLGSAISCFMMMRLATWLLPSMRTMAFQVRTVCR